jgi:hypothetical protein
MPDGRKIEANSMIAIMTTGSYSGQAQSAATYALTLHRAGQVMSYNDPEWSVFWSRGRRSVLPNV